jgi:hypothetical protein
MVNTDLFQEDEDRAAYEALLQRNAWGRRELGKHGERDTELKKSLAGMVHEVNEARDPGVQVREAKNGLLAGLTVALAEALKRLEKYEGNG